jgi:hypothetical protein
MAKKKINTRITYKLVELPSMLQLKDGDIAVLAEDDGRIVSYKGVQVFKVVGKPYTNDKGVHAVDTCNVKLHSYK